MKIELDVFSGVPNPQWTPTPEEAQRVTETLERLPGMAGAPPPLYDGLGYRGFRITESQQDGVVIVQGTMIVIEPANSGPSDSGRSSGRQVKADESRHLERQLLELSRPHLDPGLYNFLLAQTG